MTDYYGIDVIRGTTDYGDYETPADYPVCRVCGEPLAKPGS